MKVQIAGYNIDASLLNNQDKKATPETISAAYARISRSSKSVTELREKALIEVEEARRSNEKIVFEMGHSSIAEHAVFNIDIIGISRYLTEFIQKSRLASFTEKSQRYVTFDNEVVTPKELESVPSLKKEYNVTVTKLYNLYRKLSIALEYGEERLEIENDVLTHNKRSRTSDKANEDARYVLPLATETQMGMTINARSLEGMLRRLASLNLEEADQLYVKLYQQARKIAPSLIRYIEPENNQKEGFLQDIIESLNLTPLSSDNYLQTKVQLVNNEGEDLIIAALIFDKQPQDFQTLLKKVKNIATHERERVFSALLDDMKFYHKAPHYFEMVDCLIQMSLSACCFAQLKRHRMATIIRSDYNPQYGYVTPPAIKGLKLMDEIEAVMEEVASLYEKLEEVKKGLGNYILTNAHRRNILLKSNLRELYHFSRLRSDEHAQWEIRALSQSIDAQLRILLPNASSKIMGKSQIPQQDNGL